MSVVLLTSASGAPGVTTAVLGLACTWPRSVIAADADPAGGSAMLAGFFRGFQPPAQSIADLLLAHRANRLAEQLPLSLIPIDHTEAAVLTGPRSHAQARTALELWEPLGLIWKALQVTGTDVLIDAGRLGMASYAEPLLRLADVVLLVVRSDLTSLAAAKQWAERAAEARQQQPELPEWLVLLIGPNQPYSPHEVASVLGLPVLATVGWAPHAATRFSQGATGVRATRLRRQFRQCGDAVRAKIETDARLLGAGAAA